MSSSPGALASGPHRCCSTRPALPPLPRFAGPGQAEAGGHRGGVPGVQRRARDAAGPAAGHRRAVRGGGECTCLLLFSVVGCQSDKLLFLVVGCQSDKICSTSASWAWWRRVRVPARRCQFGGILALLVVGVRVGPVVRACTTAARCARWGSVICIAGCCLRSRPHAAAVHRCWGTCGRHWQLGQAHLLIPAPPRAAPPLQGAAPRGGQASAAGPAAPDAFLQTQPTTYMTRMGVADTEITAAMSRCVRAVLRSRAACQVSFFSWPESYGRHGASGCSLRQHGVVMGRRLAGLLLVANRGSTAVGLGLLPGACVRAATWPLHPLVRCPCRSQLEADADEKGKYARRQGGLQRTMKRVFPGLFQGSLPLTTKCVGWRVGRLALPGGTHSRLPLPRQCACACVRLASRRAWAAGVP